LRKKIRKQKPKRTKEVLEKVNILFVFQEYTWGYFVKLYST